MVSSLFGHITAGKIPRARYALYSLLLGLSVVFILLGGIFAMGLNEQLLNEPWYPAADASRLAQLPLSFFVLMLVMGLAYLFGQLNLAAKRCRDMGLPGWWAVLTLILFQSVVSATAGDIVSASLNTLIWLALALIPSHAFAAKNN
jgi:uncharacterized membrane protein YhaH (DUF805 family)